MMRRFGYLLTPIAALLLGACATTGKAPSPAPAMPQSFAQSFVEQAAPDAVAPMHDWWNAFGSPELSSFVVAALVTNPDLAMAGERVLQAEAQVRIAGATLWPVLNLGVDSSRRETRVDGNNWQGGSASGISLGASDEVDAWGKNSSGVRSAEASLRASRYDRESARLTLVAGVANAYFQTLSLRGRLTIARKNLSVAERVLTVVGSRVRNGAASAVDLARQQAAVLAQRAAIQPLALQERQMLLALAILLGRQPEGFDAEALDVTDLTVPRIAPGLPAQLLVRRPDLASAEAQLAAANANVTVARAALLPSIEISGSTGLASNSMLNFMNGATATITIGASLLQPIFDGGRRQGQTHVAASRERELVENFRKAVLVALAEVESALAVGGRTAEQESLQKMVVAQSRQALGLAEIRYREGADDLLTALDAQRTLFQAEDQLAQIRLSRLQASVGLFRALGGGWNMPET